MKHRNSTYCHISTVCNEWHNFQIFGDWYEVNKYEINERLHVEKDILIPGNKVYSPDTCLLVPQRINELFAYKPKDNGLPVGIRKTNNEKYGARHCGCNLGTFDTLEEAYKKYAEKKEEVIKQIAEQYKGIIPKELYSVLLRYKVDIKNDRNYKM